MNLIIDEGNTRIKLAIFNENELVEFQYSNIENCLEDLKSILKKHKIEAAILSSVTDEIISVFDDLELKNKFKLSYLTNLPFVIGYKTPKTLGVDRIALIAAACKKYPKENNLVIDAGTCITYDFIDAFEVYQGGAIAPGIEMRFKSMHHYTKKLPELNVPEYVVPLVGQNTSNCMESGVVNGMVFEIGGVIQSYQKKNKKVNVILTGGDADYLEKQLKNEIFVDPNFLLKGLNEILKYQTKDS